MIEQYSPDFDAKANDKLLPAAIRKSLKKVNKHIEQLEFHHALTVIWSVIKTADNTIEETKPWQLMKGGKEDRAQKVLAELFQILLAVNQQIAPFLPDTHAKLDQLLSARPIKKPSEPLFARKI